MPKHPPRPTSPRSIERHALTYLKRYAAPRAHLRQVLWRRASQSLMEHGGDEAEVRGWIETTLDVMEGRGYINDRAFANARAARLRRKGKSERAIMAALMGKGVDGEVARQALMATRPEGDPDLEAALTYARKRRMGPHRREDATPERIQKELGRMARAGFSYRIARRALALDEG